jgi:hypothetical protein
MSGKGASRGAGFCYIWGVCGLAALADSSLTETVPASVTAPGKICGALPDWAMAVAQVAATKLAAATARAVMR